MTTLERLTRSAERDFSCNGCLEFYQGLYCRLHKDGSRWPSTEEVARLIDQMMPPVEMGVHSPREGRTLTSIGQGLYLMFVIAHVKERM